MNRKTDELTNHSVEESVETDMNFEVKGQPYFLNFVPDEGQWFLYTPTANGIHRIPVTSDHHVERFVLPPTADEEPKVM